MSANFRPSHIAGMIILWMVQVCLFADVVEIDYWEKWSGEEGEAMREIVNAFNASQDRIYVNYSVVSQIDQKILLSVLGKSPPDVAGLWAPFVAAYADRGVINPLDSLIDEFGFDVDTLMPAFAGLCQHRDSWWAMPSSSMALVLYTNKQILIEAGYDPLAYPKTLDELADMNKRLTIVELMRDGSRRKMQFGEMTEEERLARKYEILRMGFDPTLAQDWLPYMTNWFEEDLIDPDGRIQYDSTGLKQLLDWYRNFFEMYGVEQVRRFGSSYGGLGSSSNPLFTGRVAMMINGPWLPRFMEQYAPALEYNVCPLPVTMDSASQTDPPTLVDSDILIIPRGASHPMEAFEFIAYVNQQDVSEKLNIAQSKMVPLKTRSEEFYNTHPNPFIDRFYSSAEGEGAFLVHKSVLFSRLISDVFTALDLSSFAWDRSMSFLEDAQAIIDRRYQYAEEKWDKRGDQLKKVGNLR